MKNTTSPAVSPAVRAMQRARRRSRRGFTLIEVMIVILIIVALVSLAGVAVFTQLGESKKSTTEIQMQAIKDAMQLFNLKFNRYPTEEEGLSVLWSSENLETEEDQQIWSAFLEEPRATDAWGNDWIYTTEDIDPEIDGDIGYKLSSAGPDGEPDTEDDIRSWTDADESEGIGGSSFDGPLE